MKSYLQENYPQLISKIKKVGMSSSFRLTEESLPQFYK